MTRATSHLDWLVANGYNAAANINSQAGFDATMWRQMIVEPDQLRQRVGMALLDMLVVGINGVNTNWQAFAAAAYVDVLLDNAFGNFRDLMDAITTNAAMGSFLTFLGNRKANPATGAEPDENYARELMQLFTIGLYQLNMDGSAKMAGGNPVETYTQADVSGLARVFTGSIVACTDNTTPDRDRAPLVMQRVDQRDRNRQFPRHQHDRRRDGGDQGRARHDLRARQRAAVRVETADPAARHEQPVARLRRPRLSGVREQR